MTKSSKFEIIASGNFIGGRQGYAYILNSLKFPVIDIDLDTESEYGCYCEYSKVRVLWSYGFKEYGKTTTVAHSTENGKDVWELTSGGACLSAHFGYSDLMELIDDAKAPIVKQGEVVALACHSEKAKKAFVQLFRVGRVDIHCITTATLNPLTDEEMAEVVKDAEFWCR